MGADPDGARVIAREQGTIAALLEAHGLPPLPPYITRHAKPAPEDWERYQTVYATSPGSVAAPTACLHFSQAMLAALRAAGVEIHAVTLHVGPGTFRPVVADTVEAHQIASERGRISHATAQVLDSARMEGRRVVAEGSATARW